MAVQLKSDELKGCKSYFEWLCGLVIPEEKCYLIAPRGQGKDYMTGLVRQLFDKNFDEKEFGSKGAGTPFDLNNVESGFEIDAGEIIGKIKLCRYLFGVDFSVVDWCKEDETQAANGMALRRRYAEGVGQKLGKSGRDIDRIWKSIHGKCSVLELLVHLCIRLDEMTNEEESGKTVGQFFDILLGNLAFDITDSEAGWAAVTGKFLHREYEKDGSGGGLFPIKNAADKDIRSMPIWFQLNTWLNEHLNENAEFEW